MGLTFFVRKLTIVLRWKGGVYLMALQGENSGVAQNWPVAASDPDKARAAAYGRELIAELGAVGHAFETYQDLCLGLQTIQVKQVNELLRLIRDAKAGD
jgi:hypothetical protein